MWKIEGIGPDRQEQLTKLAKIWRKIKREANEAWANKRDQFNLDSVNIYNFNFSLTFCPIYKLCYLPQE